MPRKPLAVLRHRGKFGTKRAGVMGHVSVKTRREKNNSLPLGGRAGDGDYPKTFGLRLEPNISI